MSNLCNASAFQLLLLTISVSSVSALRADWKSFIDPEMYKKYAGKGNKGINDTLFQGDIDNIDLGSDESRTKDLALALNVVNDAKRRWPDNTIPYTISPKFTETEKNTIVRAMSEMAELTEGCVRFVSRRKETDYINVIRGLGCSSAVGRQGGKQEISFTRGCSEELGDIQHELMHALGFYHEQSRMDRDQYVTINWDNIAPKNKLQFEKFDGLTFGLPYDYLSVTHYPWNGFAVSSSFPTILPTEKNVKIGQKANLSKLDVRRIKKVYGCDDEDESTTLESAVDEDDTTSTRSTTATTTTTEMEEDEVTTRRTRSTKKPVSRNICPSFDPSKCTIEQEGGCENGFLKITCDNDVSPSDINSVLDDVNSKDSKARPIALQLNGEMALQSDIFEAVKDRIYILYISDDASNLDRLSLPKLVHLGIRNVLDLKLRRSDLVGFPELAVIELDRKTSLASVEENAFLVPGKLKLISFAHDMDFPKDRSDLANLKMVHCDCSHAWLRRFLQENPGLRTPKREGELYKVGLLKSPAFRRADLSLPVDCSKSDLQGDILQAEFSINDQCDDGDESVTTVPVTKRGEKKARSTTRGRMSNSESRSNNGNQNRNGNWNGRGNNNINPFGQVQFGGSQFGGGGMQSGGGGFMGGSGGFMSGGGGGFIGGFG